jgi:hypothetical protein
MGGFRDSRHSGIVGHVVAELGRFRDRLTEAGLSRAERQPAWIAGRWAHHPHKGWYWVDGHWR